MSQYLLDTNIIIYYLRHADSFIRDKFQQIPLQQLSVCSVVKAELFYGAAKSNQAAKSREIQDAFLRHLFSYPFDDKATDHYARIRADLEKQGQPIGGNDLMIASIALANQLILVSANHREFARVQGLKIENWMEVS